MVNVNRLTAYHPWEGEEPSIPLRDEPTVLQDWSQFVLEEGLLCVVRLAPESGSVPWAVGRILGLIIVPDKPTVIHLQWYGNNGGNVEGMHLPGWRRSNGTVYYRERPEHYKHVPYTNEHDGTVVDQEMIHTTGFRLLASHRLPRDVLTYLNTGREER